MASEYPVQKASLDVAPRRLYAYSGMVPVLSSAHANNCDALIETTGFRRPRTFVGVSRFVFVPSPI